MEVWQWKLITGNTQLANNTVYIKTIILFDAAAKNVTIYNEKAAGTTAVFLTIYNTANELTKVIMFDDPCQLDTGCYIASSAWPAGLLVQYKPV